MHVNNDTSFVLRHKKLREASPRTIYIECLFLAHIVFCFTIIIFEKIIMNSVILY